MIGLKVARKKMLEEAVLRIFELFEATRPFFEKEAAVTPSRIPLEDREVLEKHGATDLFFRKRAKLDLERIPREELESLFTTVFERVKPKRYFCGSRMCFVVSPIIRDSLGEGLFSEPAQPLMEIGWTELSAVYDLVGALQQDI